MTDATRAPAPAAIPRHAWLALVALLLGMFIALLDTTIVNVALPTIRTSLENDCVLVQIRDTGPGVPPELTERIFEPFFTTKPVGEGTGLGLDISWRIVVKRHGGDLRVVSVPGDTTFEVRLPAKPADPA